MRHLRGRTRRRDWANLPPELLQLVSKRVAEIGDYVRFGAVCKSWRSAASPAANLPPQIPWLLLPYDSDDTVRCFFSLSSRRVYRFDLPNFRGRAITSCSPGWMLMVDTSLSFSLLNPFTHAHIHLPPLPNVLLEVCRPLLRCLNKLATDRYGRLDSKTQLLTMHGRYQIAFRCYSFMSNDGDHIVALVVLASQLMYCRVRDGTWIFVNRHSLSFQSMIAAVTYHCDRFYIVYQTGEVATCELSPGAKTTLVSTLRVPVDFCFCYLVVADGELLMLTSLFNEAGGNQPFDCFKLDSEGQLKWSRIQEFGQCTLFLRRQENVIATTVGQSSGCRRNCIYNYGFLGRAPPKQQLYVTSLGDDKVELLSHLEVEYNREHLQPIWFMPTL